MILFFNLIYFLYLYFVLSNFMNFDFEEKENEIHNIEINKNKIKNDEIIQQLINEIENLKKENIQLKQNITKINERLLNLEKFHYTKNRKKIKLTNSKIKNTNIIKSHNNYINSISTFPLGNIISVSDDKSIKIYNIHFELLQNIENAHNNGIIYVNIKDEKNFVSCSFDIKTWINKGNNTKFEINKIIKNAHNDKIMKVIFYKNNFLISCSWDKTIKIWEENNTINSYVNITILKDSNCLNSFLLLNDKNILISSGEDGTKCYTLNTFNIIFDVKKTWCGYNNAICRINTDNIIVKGKGTNNLKIISIEEKKIIKQIKNDFQCNCIYVINDKSIFLIGGKSNVIKVFKIENFEFIFNIENSHFDDIKGFEELNDSSIISYSNDGIIKVWEF